MGDDGQLALCHGHDVLQQQLALGNALVDALAGGAADVETLDALLNIIFGEGADGLGGDVSVFVIAGVECRDNACVFAEILHFFYLLFQS